MKSNANLIKIGLIGAGTVGCGVIKLLSRNKGIIEKRTGVRLDLKRIADNDLERKRPVRLPKDRITTDAFEVIRDESIDIVVELVGGTTVARDFVMAAIDNGKHVVTANKALIAHHGREIFQSALQKGVSVGFEASVGGGIPIIRAMRDGYVGNKVLSIHGIMNGTSNYVLSRMTERMASANAQSRARASSRITRGGEKSEFEEVLKEAQRKGYAEADPSFDIDGVDSAHKLSIMIMLSFGVFLAFEDIHVEGIRGITPLDVAFADELGYRIKLLATAKAKDSVHPRTKRLLDNVPESIEAGVYPTLIKKGTSLADVSGAFNAIYLVGDAIGPTMLYGLGAGMMPTASAVVSDISRISSLYDPAPRLHVDFTSSPLIKMSETSNKYYLKFNAHDRPGVLGKITGRLGRHGISIESVIQKGRHPEGGGVPIVIMTHEAQEKKLLSALEQIDKFPDVSAKSTFIRIGEI